MILNLSGEVNYETLNQLVRGLNELRVGDNLHIYFTTEGGQVDVAESVIDIVNKNKDKIEIIFYGEVFSAGMYIFLKADCQKWVLPDTTGMYHYSWQEVTIKEGGKPSSAYDIFAMKEMKRAKTRTVEYLKTTKLTDKEVNSIKAGKDVYFSYERMLALL